MTFGSAVEFNPFVQGTIYIFILVFDPQIGCKTTIQALIIIFTIGIVIVILVNFSAKFQNCGLDFEKGMSFRPPPKVSIVSSYCLLCRSERFWKYSHPVKSYGRKLSKKCPFFRRFPTLNPSRFQKGWLEDKIFKIGTKDTLKIHLSPLEKFLDSSLFFKRVHSLNHFFQFFMIM